MCVYTVVFRVDASQRIIKYSVPCMVSTFLKHTVYAVFNILVAMDRGSAISIKQPTSLFLDSTHSSESSMDLNTGLWAQRTSLCAWNRDPSSDISSTSLRLRLLMYAARSNGGSARRQEREK